MELFGSSTVARKVHVPAPKFIPPVPSTIQPVHVVTEIDAAAGVLQVPHGGTPGVKSEYPVVAGAKARRFWVVESTGDGAEVSSCQRPVPIDEVVFVR